MYAAGIRIKHDVRMYFKSNDCILHNAWHRDEIPVISKHLNFKQNMCQYQLPIILTLYRLNDRFEKKANIVDCSKFLDCDASLGKCSCNSITYGDFLSSNETLKNELNDIKNNSKHLPNDKYILPNELLDAKRIAISHAWMSTSKNDKYIKDCITFFTSLGKNKEVWLDLIDLNGKWTDEYTADKFGDQVIIVEPCLAERSEKDPLNWQALLLSPWSLRGWTLVELLVAKNVWIWTYSGPIKLEYWVGDEGIKNLSKNELVNVGIIGLSLNLLKENNKQFKSTIVPVTKENKFQDQEKTKERDIAWIVTALSSRIWTYNADLVKALYQFIRIKEEDNKNIFLFINLIKHADEHCGLWLTTRLGKQSTYDGWIPYCLPFSGIQWYKNAVYLVKNPRINKEGLTFKAWIYKLDKNDKIEIRTPINSMNIFIRKRSMMNYFTNTDTEIEGVMNVLHRGNIRYDMPSNSKSWFDFLGKNPTINNKNFAILSCKHDKIKNEGEEDEKYIPCNKCMCRCVIYFHENRISFTGILRFKERKWDEMIDFTVS